MISIDDLFDARRTAARDYLTGLDCIWKFGEGLSAYIYDLGERLPDDYTRICGGVWVLREAEIAGDSVILPPAEIGKESEIRHCAYIRGAVVVGEGCVVGNSCEVKNSVLFDRVKIPHFNYVGDSILGYGSHFGAGAITANVKSDGGEIVLRLPSRNIPTGAGKLGALVGDGCEIGCNSVLNPGAVIGRDSIVYPLSSVRGYIPPRSVVRRDGKITGRH